MDKFKVYDIIGIGLLNLDFIVNAGFVKSDLDLGTEPDSKFELGTETHVGDSTINQSLSQFDPSQVQKTLGGSAFGVIRTVACLSNSFELGYIGIAGDTEEYDLDFVKSMNDMKIDTSFVGTSSKPSGRCVSYLAEGERTLLTSPGANVDLGEYISSNYFDILEYVCRTKVVHVTSLFDEHSPKIVAQLLKEAKERNPWLKISFDPGHQWVTDVSPAVEQILDLADFVFLNDREFQILGNYKQGKSDAAMAQEIFDRCEGDQFLITLKRYNLIKLVYKFQNRILERIYENDVLPPEQIQDSTGAGDIFAASFIVGLLLPVFEIQDGIKLGLDLVHEKLKSADAQYLDKFPDIFSGFVDELGA